MGDVHTEFDSILITKKAIFILEIKNSTKDLLIDEKGDLYINDGIVKFDSKLGFEMNEKEFIIRNLLNFTSVDELEIEKLVVFTNSAIKVENKSKFVKDCFLSDLPYIIDNYNGENIYTKRNISQFSKLIKNMRFFEKHKVKEDIDKYKTSFANILSKIECFGGSEIGQTYIEKIKVYKDEINTIYNSKKIKEKETITKPKENKWIVSTILTILSGVISYFIGKTVIKK